MNDVCNLWLIKDHHDWNKNILSLFISTNLWTNHLLAPFFVYFLAKNGLKTFIKLGNIPTWVMPNLQLRSLPQMLACQYCHVSRLTWDEPGTLSFQSEACFYRPHWRLREQRLFCPPPSWLQSCLSGWLMALSEWQELWQSREGHWCHLCSEKWNVKSVISCYGKLKVFSFIKLIVEVEVRQPWVC